MPYIKPERRPEFEDEVRSLTLALRRCNPGDLNYIIFAAVKRYLSWSGVSYEQVRHIRAELAECSMEIWRRFLVEHEINKILENGDIE